MRVFQLGTPTFLCRPKLLNQGVDVILPLAEDATDQPKISLSGTEIAFVQLLEEFVLVLGLKRRRVIVKLLEIIEG